MKKISQLILIIIIVVVVQIISAPICCASAWGDIFEQGDKFIEDGKPGAEIINGAAIKMEFNKIYNILFTLGVVLTVLIGAILGIKFIFGSVEGQAKVKEMLFPYIVGCIVIFGAFGIWKLVVTLLAKI